MKQMMLMMWNEQMDFIFLIYGLTFLLMAVVCTMLRQQNSALPWKWLALFGFTHGTGEWMDMLAIGLFDSPEFAIARKFVHALSFIFLLEFGRRGTTDLRARAVWPWIALGCAALFSVGAEDGLPWVDASVRYCLGLPGGLWAGATLLQAARLQQSGRKALRWAAAAMVLYGLSAGLVTSAASFPPASFLNYDTFLSLLGVPVQLARCLLAISLTWALWKCYQALDREAQLKHPRLFIFVLLLIMLIGAGWGSAQWMAELQKARQLATIVDLAQRTALAISPEHIKELAGSPADLESLPYRRVKQQLTAMRHSLQQARFLYLLRPVNGRAVFLADSEPPGSRDESLPGDIYEEASRELLHMFVSGAPFTEGPHGDRWGSWYSGYVPIRDRRTGSLIAVLGIDQDARIFKAAPEAERFKAFGLTALLCLSVLLIFACTRRFQRALIQAELNLSSDRLLTWGIMAIVMLIGTTLSLAAFIEHRYYARDLFLSALRQQSALQAKEIAQELESQLEDLDGLRRFVVNQDFVTRSEFAGYVRPMQERFAVQAVEWAPRVLRGQREQYEHRARQEGLTAMRITEKGPAGALIPAPDRDEYFPAYYVEPLQGNETVVGFDLASEPLRWEAMRKACDQGHAACTAPLRLVQEKAGQIGFVIFSPIYDNGLTPLTIEQRRLSLRGFVLVAYRMNDYMQGVLASLESTAFPFLLVDLSAPAENHLLYSHARELFSPIDWAPSFTTLLDMAHRDWQLTISPSRDFVKHNLSHAYWFTLAAGLLLTALLALYLNSLITGRFQAEELVHRKTAQLKQSEQRFQLALEASREGLWDWNIAEGTAFFSRQWKEMLGFSLEEIPGSPQNLQKHIYSEDVAMVQQTMERHFKGETEVYETEYRMLCRDGTWKWIHARGRVISRAEDGRPLRMVGTHSNISQRKADEQKLKQAMAELKRSNAELEQFAYVSSHDLQEPLRMVSSYMQLVKRRYSDTLDAAANEFIDFAVDGAQRMQTLINDLLAYSRVTTRGNPFAPTDCNEALREALGNLQLLIAETDARVDCGALPTVPADSSQLAQLFQNLIGNALKYRSSRQPQISIGAERRQQEWLFSVKDNGLGIEPQYFERIFVIFQRLHGRDEYPGTGIGLAVCRKIVERHGGAIWVSSEPGSGATFYFTLLGE